MKTLPALKLLFPFVIGLLIPSSITTPKVLTLGIVTGAILLLFDHYVIVKKVFLKRGFSNIIAYACLIILGNFTKVSHRTSTPNFDDLLFKQVELKGTVKKIESKTTKTTYTLALFDNNKASKFKLHAYVKNNHSDTLNVGDIVNAKGMLLPFNGAKNPHQFDYKHYLQTQNIIYKLRVEQIVVTQKSNFSIAQTAAKVQAYIKHKIKRYIPSETGKQIIFALLLGDKSMLEQNTKNTFQLSGTIHILAISGLHVGLIAWLIQWLVKWFRPKNKSLSILKATFVILSIWCYAFLTGLSPSVMRAATMFSFISIGFVLNRRDLTKNNIFLSAFILLLIDSSLLTNFGFLLSYSAVLSIVYFTPFIYKKIKTNHKHLNKFIQAIAVSFAAQVGTMPLIIHLFGYLSVIAWLTSLFAIFMATIILYSCIGLSLLSTLPFTDTLCSFIGQCIDWCINLLVKILNLTNSIPYTIINDLVLDTRTLLIAYLALVLLALFLLVNKKRYIGLTLFAILAFSLSDIYHHASSNQRDELIFFNSYQNVYLQYHKGHHGITFHDELSPYEQKYLREYNRQEFIKNTSQKLPNNEQLIINNTSIAFINSNQFKVTNTVDYIVLTGNFNQFDQLPVTPKTTVFLTAATHKKVKYKFYKWAKENEVKYYNLAKQKAFTIKQP